jgi:RNA polymerase sigma-70 factor, ECF subfamily
VAGERKPLVQRSERLQRFDVVYQAHGRALHDYFLGRTADPETAADLLQETCIRLWRSLDTVHAQSAEHRRAWLFTVAHNLVVDHFRSRATAATTRNALAQRKMSGEPRVAPPAEADAASRERLRALDAAMQRLPDDLRTVLVLQVLGDRTSVEIGELLGRPPGTVRYQLAVARRRLAEELRLIDPEAEEVPS